MISSIAACVVLASFVGAEPGAAPPYRVDDLDWMVGRWVGQGLGGTIEEVMLPASGGAMPCVFRLLSPDGSEVRFYEFVLYENTEEGVQILLHHFSPGLARWEDEAVAFDLVELDERRALFAEREDSEEETRLSYERTDDRLVAELIERQDGEDVVTARFSYTLTPGWE